MNDKVVEAIEIQNFEEATIEDAKKVMQNMFNDITPEKFEELKKQAIENVKQNNMSAKEMFEKLGYKYGKYAEEIICTKEDRQWREVGEITIDFDLQGKTIELGFDGRISENLPVFITLEELQAINKQIEELGWNNE